jgi:predicted nucleic acid-binding Zn ribbon protein
MHCENCGKNIDRDAKFCKHCGHKTLVTNNPKRKNSSNGLKVVLLIMLGIALLFLFYNFNSTKKDTPKVERPNAKYCNRTQPYNKPPEFTRAVSLIEQRMRAAYSQGYYMNLWVNVLSDIENCLDIQYATNDQQMESAEGLFVYDRNSTNDRLRIFVSPRYQEKDDILTAVLLTHEISHAITHVYGTEGSLGCFGNEAAAFTNQSAFLNALTQEEKNSVNARAKVSPTKEIRDFIDIYNFIAAPGDVEANGLAFVKSQPFYQKECAGK